MKPLYSRQVMTSHLACRFLGGLIRWMGSQFLVGHDIDIGDVGDGKTCRFIYH